MMRGYWGDEIKTNNSIKPVTINGKTGKYYFTGDLVCVDPDGNIKYVGRKDNMVKTRGFRVELGEIESALNKHDEVDLSAVFPVPDEFIGNRLYAFIQSESNGNLYHENLVKHCSKFLPSYMVPETFKVIDNFPKTSTGKIDRQKLKTMIE